MEILDQIRKFISQYSKTILSILSGILSILLIVSILWGRSKSEKEILARLDYEQAKKDWEDLDSVIQSQDSIIWAWRDSVDKISWSLEQAEFDKIQANVLLEQNKGKTIYVNRKKQIWDAHDTIIVDMFRHLQRPKRIYER